MILTVVGQGDALSNTTDSPPVLGVVVGKYWSVRKKEKYIKDLLSKTKSFKPLVVRNIPDCGCPYLPWEICDRQCGNNLYLMDKELDERLVAFETLTQLVLDLTP